MRILGVLGVAALGLVAYARTQPAAKGAWRLRVGDRSFTLGCTAGGVPKLETAGEACTLAETTRSGDLWWRSRRYAVEGPGGQGELTVWERRTVLSVWQPDSCRLEIGGEVAAAD